MELQGDLRSVLHPRSSVDRIVQQLTEARDRAEPITLSVQNIGTLLTFIRAATRRAAAARRPECQAAHADAVASLQYSLRKMTEAWEASERELWRRDRTPSKAIEARGKEMA